MSHDNSALKCPYNLLNSMLFGFQGNDLALPPAKKPKMDADDWKLKPYGIFLQQTAHACFKDSALRAECETKQQRCARNVRGDCGLPYLDLLFPHMAIYTMHGYFPCMQHACSITVYTCAQSMHVGFVRLRS